jgi:cytochrome c oxidase subunit III
MSDTGLVRRDFIITDSMAYWGTVIFVISEAAVFVFLLFSYYYFAIQPRPEQWPPNGLPSLTLSLTATLILVASGPVSWIGARAAESGNRPLLQLSLAAVFVMGIAYIILQYFDWQSKTFTIQNAYGSLYYTITGFHVAHTLVGVGMVLAVMAWTYLGYIGRANSTPVSIVMVYWYFLVVIVIAVFFTLNLTPYLGLTQHV